MDIEILSVFSFRIKKSGTPQLANCGQETSERQGPANFCLIYFHRGNNCWSNKFS